MSFKNLYQMGDDSNLYRDATEKVLILRKTVQDKVYLYVFHYYILYVKTVFQWRPYRGGSHLPSGIQTGCKTTCYCNFTPCFINCYSSHAPFAKRSFGLPRSFATTFAHKKALPSSLCIQLIPHASMIIT